MPATAGSGSSPARALRNRSVGRARSGYVALPFARGVHAKGTRCYPPGTGVYPARALRAGNGQGTRREVGPLPRAGATHEAGTGSIPAASNGAEPTPRRRPFPRPMAPSRK